MKLLDFLKTWHGTQDENRFHRRSNTALLTIIGLLMIALLSKTHTVVMVPPGLNEAASITANSANDETRRAWALFYATLIGNVTPANAQYLSQQLAPGLTPRLYHEVNEALTAQVRQVQAEQITTRFSPTQTSVSAKSGHVFVTGHLITEGLRGNTDRETRTYEFGFLVSNYRVLLDTMVIHKGEVGPNNQEKSS